MPSSKERVPVVIVEYDEIARTIARRIAEIIKERRRAGGHAVLGLATGSTPIGIYRELIKMHREEGLDFSDVVTFNLDEYYPMKPDSIHSYHRFMRENLFNHINVRPENVHIPPGDIARLHTLAGVHRALKPGGRIAVLEFVPNPDRVSPPVPARISSMTFF